MVGFLIYLVFIKNKNFLKYFIFGNIVLLVIFYIVLYVKLFGGEVSKYIFVFYFKILFYIILLGLVYLIYRVLDKKDKEEVEENVKLLGIIFEKEEDRGE